MTQVKDLEQTRQEIRRLRREAARTLDEVEWRAHAIDEALAELETARFRTLLLDLRRRLIAPLTAFGYLSSPFRVAIEWLIVVTRLRRLEPAFRHATERASPLRGLSPAACETDQPALTEAIRWVEPVTLRGARRHALVMHPTSAAMFDLTLEPGASLRAYCGFVPEVMLKNRDGVVFEATVAAADASWTASAALHVSPRRRWLDRGWRALTVNLPAGAAGPAQVRLETRLPIDGSPEFAWAIWGEPQLAWRRSAGEMLRLATAAVRRDGWIGAVRRLDHAGVLDGAREYRRWLDVHAPRAEDLERLRAAVAALPYQPLISVITPTYNTDPRWLKACVDSVRNQVYSNWEMCLVDDASTRRETIEAIESLARSDRRIKYARMDRNSHISAASNRALDFAAGDFIALLDHDDELSPDALGEVVTCLNAHPDADFVYSDEDKLDPAGQRSEPYFKPDWSPEHFLNFMYTNHLMVLRRAIVEQVGRFRVGFEGSQDYDLALRVISVTDRVYHVPKVLYHWRQVSGSAAAEPVAKPWALEAARRALRDHVERNQLEAEVLDGELQGLFRVRPKIRGTPLVTIIVPTDDRTRDLDGRLFRLLPNAVRSIVQRTAYKNYELLIVDNGRVSDETRSFLADVPHRRVSYAGEGPFNFSRKLNFSAAHARGEHLVIFNDDLEVITSEWLTALLEYSQQQPIGAVGGKLLFPDGRLQHIGMVLGVCGGAAHAFHCAPPGSGGYCSSAKGVRNYSAVTGACMMTRRDVFEEVGGFNEQLAIDFNDVDYCLRVRKVGYRIVFTPYAELYHYESGTLGPRAQNKAEVELALRTWREVMAADPYYNPNLSREFPDYRLS